MVSHVDAASAAAEGPYRFAYERLRRLAARYMAGERMGHTLQPTALVHEAYLRLADDAQVPADPADFFARAAQAMRRVLVDHARRHGAVKRGAGRARVSLDEGRDACASEQSFVVALDEALGRLATVDSFQSRIVELRFFGGLTVDETAELLGVSSRSMNREWALAKGFLYREMTRDK